MQEITDFKELVTTNKDNYIDKSLFIKEVLADSEANLILRPPKFGKSINLSMLNYFFNINYQTKELFKDLKIMQEDEKYTKHLNTIPTIYINFKDCTASTYFEMETKFKGIITKLYQKYSYLETSDKLNHYDKQHYEKGIKQSFELIDTGLYYLTHLLYKHHGKYVLVLIDDIDIPIKSGIKHNYSEEILNLLINMIACVQYTPSYTTQIILTARNLPAPELNKLSAAIHNNDTIINSKYAESFGFTKDEVTKLLSINHLEKQISKVCDYYGGYNIGNISNLSNPGNIINYIKAKKLTPLFPKDNLNKISIAKEELEKLLNGEELIINIKHSMNHYFEHDDAPLLDLLLNGYLTYSGNKCGDSKIDYEHFRIKIPNKEIMTIIKE